MITYKIYLNNRPEVLRINAMGHTFDKVESEPILMLYTEEAEVVASFFLSQIQGWEVAKSSLKR